MSRSVAGIAPHFAPLEAHCIIQAAKQDRTSSRISHSRGGTGLTVSTSGTAGARTLCNHDLAVGKYWTPHDVRPGDFVTYLSINGFTTLDDRGPTCSHLSLTPGLRFHLRNDYSFGAGVEVPVTGPKTANFACAPIYRINKVW
jgi:hypothetical protein